MNDLISRKAVIDSIKEIFCNDCNNYHGVICRACDIADAIGMVEDAPAVAYKLKATEPMTTCQQWIPVSERLPEIDGRYATVCKFGNGVTTRGFLSFAKDGEKVDYELTGKKNVWYEYDREWGFVSIDSVTHWMMLPEPPKEG